MFINYFNALNYITSGVLLSLLINLEKFIIILNVINFVKKYSYSILIIDKKINYPENKKKSSRLHFSRNFI